MKIEKIDFITKHEKLSSCAEEILIYETIIVTVKRGDILIPVKMEQNFLDEFKDKIFMQAEQIFESQKVFVEE